MVETLDDVIEEICDAMGVYGAHVDPADGICSGPLRCWCRVCVSSYLGGRIRKAAEVERLLSGKVVTA